MRESYDGRFAGRRELRFFRRSGPEGYEGDGVKSIKGSATGVRVGGGSSGALLLLATAVGAWGASNLWLGLPLATLFGFMMIRPWFLGVDVGPGKVRIRSWFRDYRLEEGEVVAIDLVNYTGFMGFGLGWVPIAGRVAMLEIETREGRFRWFPATFNTWNRTLRIARQARAALGVPPE